MEHPISSFSIALGAASVGVASHLTYFVRGEHHLHSTRLVGILFAAPFILFLGILHFTGYQAAAEITAIMTISYLSALTASILSYRAFFHPLCKFPGPLTARLSQWQHILRVWNKLDNFRQSDRLHKKYGPIVRMGPNELSIIIPESVPVILGPSSKCQKSPWYDAVGYPNTSLHATRDREEHDKRRRVWDHAFSAKALRNYEGSVSKYANEVVSQISKRSGEPLNATLWSYLFAFDVMGDLAFGKSFDALKVGKMHYAVELMREEPEKPDIMSWLLDGETYAQNPRRSLNGDSRLVIGAGSETTAGVMTHILYHLAEDQRVISKLYAELENLNFPTEAMKLKDARYLNSVISESLRLHPAIPGGVFRQTPPEGILIDTKDGPIHIPGNVTVSEPAWTIGRCIYSCIGKQLALMEIRAVISRIVTHFDIEFAPGEDGLNLLNKTKDVFTMEMAPLMLAFTRKQKI
ncbi:benzoate 4-monooxygenase cytochrome P450 [Phlyctema vagabunda]|uniref:Benzoate 4-monooxygenase cytochrome P450 n=1 Tax=Phlyctema vagabunda TaxID=108571 RepID=A0ABR4PBG1_9HELO